MSADNGTDLNNLDLVWGAAEIGKVISANPRRTWYLLEKGMLPARKVGAQWVASRNRLRSFFLGEAA